MHCESTLAALLLVKCRRYHAANQPAIVLRAWTSNLCLAGSIDGYTHTHTHTHTSVGDENDPSELVGARETMDAQKLGIVFKTTNKVRATELVCCRQLQASNSGGVVPIVSFVWLRFVALELLSDSTADQGTQSFS